MDTQRPFSHESDYLIEAEPGSPWVLEWRENHFPIWGLRVEWGPYWRGISLSLGGHALEVGWERDE